MAGAVVGSQIGDGSGRAAAIILGSVLGAVLGAELGRDMDEEDRACFGHTLELGKRGQTVSWRAPYGVAYAVTPLDEFVKAGGSAKCLTLRLDGEEAASWRSSALPTRSACRS